ncbi:MAG: hypothetical protein ACOC9P_00760 [bacterium]
MELGQQVLEDEGDLIANVKRILADHQRTDDHPDSAPCRHDGAGNAMQFSLIMDVSDRSVYYCGQPCSAGWRRAALSPS